MAITFVGSAVGSTTAVALPAFNPGDVGVMFLFVDGSSTAPTLPTGWTSIDSTTQSGAGSRVGYRVLQAGDNSGTPSGNSNFVVNVYRGLDTIVPIGTSPGKATGNAGTVTYAAVTMNLTNNTSWVVGFGGHRSTNTTIETAPTGMTARTSTVLGSAESASYDTNGTVSSYGPTSRSVGGSASNWATHTIELRAPQTSITATDAPTTSESADHAGSSFFRDATEAASATDVASRTYLTTATESVATSESVARSADIGRSPTDLVSLNRPQFRSLGTFGSSTVTNFTAGLPTGWQPNDIFIAVFRHNTSGAGMSAGWTRIGSQQTLGSGAFGTVFWRRAQAGDTAPTFLSTSNACARIAAYSGCITTGDPFEAVQGGGDSTADTSFTSTGITTTGDNRLYLCGIARGGDSAAGFYSNEAASGVINVVEQIDQGHTLGTGGGIALFEGLAPTAGSYGPWTATNTSITDCYVEFALIGSDSADTTTAYFRSATEAPTLSESADQAKNAIRTATDAPTTSESIVRQVQVSRDATDSPSASETATADVAGAGTDRTTTDAITTSEAVTTQYAAQRTATDSPATSESISTIRGLRRSATDHPITSESVTRTEQLSRSTTDSPTTSDTATRIITKSRSVTEAVTASDAATQTSISATPFTFDLDAVIQTSGVGGFGIDSYILTQAHDRTLAHFGTQDDTVVVTMDGLDPWPAGTTVHAMLADLFAGAYGQTQPNGRFGLDAWIHPYLQLYAVLQKSQSGSVGFDALISKSGSFSVAAVIKDVPLVAWNFNAYIINPFVQGHTFSLSAWILRNQSSARIFSAYIVQRQTGSFGLDAVIS